jgi:integral membrane protein
MTRAESLAVDRLAGPLIRYRAMAYIVGAGLVVLVFVGMPLKYWAGVRTVVAVVGPVHGVLYLVYLVAVLDLARVRRLPVLQVLMMVGAGLLPFLAFYVERRTTRIIERDPVRR